MSAHSPTRSTNHTCCNNKLVLTIFSNFTHCATCTAHVTFLPPFTLISSSNISKPPNCCSHLQEANSSTYDQNLIPGPYFVSAESDQDPHAQFPLTQCNSSSFMFSWTVQSQNLHVFLLPPVCATCLFLHQFSFNCHYPNFDVSLHEILCSR